MAQYHSFRVTRPISASEDRSAGGLSFEHPNMRTVARNVACEIYTAASPSSGTLRWVRSCDYAQALIPPMADVRDGDFLIDPHGQAWEIEILSRNGAQCRCALRSVVRDKR